MTRDDFIEFLKDRCKNELAKITDTTGVWSHEGGMKKAYEDIVGYINIYEREHFNG